MALTEKLSPADATLVEFMRDELLAAINTEPQFRQVCRDAFNKVKHTKPGQETEAIRTMFDTIAKYYDSLTACRTWDKEVASLCHMLKYLHPDDKTIVDEGCGTGLDLCAIAISRPHLRCLGYDISPKMVEAATKRAKKHNIDNIEFRVGQAPDIAQSIPFGSVDLLYVKSPYTQTNVVIGSNNITQKLEKIDTFESTIWQARQKMLRPCGTFAWIGVLSLEYNVTSAPGFKTIDTHYQYTPAFIIELSIAQKQSE